LFTTLDANSSTSIMVAFCMYIYTTA